MTKAELLASFDKKPFVKRLAVVDIANAPDSIKTSGCITWSHIHFMELGVDAEGNPVAVYREQGIYTIVDSKTGVESCYYMQTAPKAQATVEVAP